MVRIWDLLGWDARDLHRLGRIPAPFWCPSSWRCRLRSHRSSAREPVVQTRYGLARCFYWFGSILLQCSFLFGDFHIIVFYSFCWFGVISIDLSYGTIFAFALGESKLLVISLELGERELWIWFLIRCITDHTRFDACVNLDSHLKCAIYVQNLLLLLLFTFFFFGGGGWGECVFACVTN